MSVGIVIPAWNLWKEMTFPCLQSIKKYSDNETIHVYLVDNASTDETSSFAPKIGEGLFGSKHFTYIHNNENKGFAIASNQGAEAACADGCQFILFLNNDTLVTKDWLPPLIQAMENPRIGMVGPLLLYPNNTVQHCGVVRDFNGFLIHIYSSFPRHHSVIQNHRKYKILTGAALMVRANEFMQLGKFYEEYQNGFEDVDLCCQYNKNGLIGEVITDSVVYHLESQTPGRLDEARTRHNDMILKSRNLLPAPNAHLYYEKDDIVPAYSKDFIFYPRLKEEKRHAMNKKIMQEYSDSLCYQMIKEEPLWYDGYYFLIESMLKQKFYSEAIECCTKVSHFYAFNTHVYHTYLRCFELLGNENSYNQAERVIDNARKQLEFWSVSNKTLFKQHVSGTIWEEKLLSTMQLEYIDFDLLEKFKKRLQ